MNCAVYVRNRSPTTSLPGKTPYECWFGKKPDLSNLRVFGCVSYVHIHSQLRKKLDPKSEKSIFIGYPDGTKGYKLYSLKSEKFLHSKSVLFHEDEFLTFDLDMKDQKLFLFPEEIKENDDENDELTLNNSNYNENITDTDDMNLITEVYAENTHNENSVKETYEEKYLNEVLNIDKRERKPPDRLIEQLNYLSEYCMFTESLVVDIDEPKCVIDALNNPNWYEAMNSEMSSLIKNNTSELVTKPHDKNVIGCRWVFKEEIS